MEPEVRLSEMLEAGPVVTLSTPKPVKAALVWVAPEAAQALQEHVRRREIGDEMIGINIDALLHDLRGDQHTTASPAAGLWSV